MSSARIMKTMLLGLTAACALNACAVIDKKDSDEESNWFVQMFEKNGNEEASQATVAYSQGDFKKAAEFVAEALKANPRNQQALLVGALTAEKTGRLNRARQYYEDLIIIGGNETTILGTDSNVPEKIVDIAKKKLRMLEVKQSELLIENKDGVKAFNISEQSSAEQSAMAIQKALNKKPVVKAKKTPDVGELFTPQEQNIISRFLTLKELAEKDLITQEEFLTRRQANIGGLLPLTNKPGGTGIDEPVPSPDLIVERIEVLKEAVENRAISPQEFSAERDTIIIALMDPEPRERMKPKAPSRDIFGAAKDLRKLEALYDLNLITAKEKAREKAAVERYLGIRKNTGTQKKNVATASVSPSKVVEQPKKSGTSVSVVELPVSSSNQPVNLLVNTQGQTNTIERVEEVKKVEVPSVEEIERYRIDGTVSIKPEKGSSSQGTVVPDVSSPF